ncbi:MAG TPA: hypothetical protein PLV56_09990 [Synergistales bacterium]|nr:hypothetical protein [Synergistales bacterium]
MTRKNVKEKAIIKGRVFRAGNSLALRIPSEISKRYDLIKGSGIIIHTEKNGFKVKPDKEDLSLEKLVSLINENNRHDLEDWGSPEGNEVW